MLYFEENNAFHVLFKILQGVRRSLRNTHNEKAEVVQGLLFCDGVMNVTYLSITHTCTLCVSFEKCVY